MLSHVQGECYATGVLISRDITGMKSTMMTIGGGITRIRTLRRIVGVGE